MVLPTPGLPSRRGFMGRSCSFTTIQAASSWRISSSWPTHRTASSSGCARCRVTPSISTFIVGYVLPATAAWQPGQSPAAASQPGRPRKTMVCPTVGGSVPGTLGKKGARLAANSTDDKIRSSIVREQDGGSVLQFEISLPLVSYTVTGPYFSMIVLILATSPTATICALAGLIYFFAIRSTSSAVTAAIFSG